MIREIKGFSLMELMIVVVLIGILSASGILFFTDRAEQARIEAATVSTSAIHLVQQEYRSNNGSYYYTSAGCSSNTTNQIRTSLSFNTFVRGDIGSRSTMSQVILQ